MASNTYPKIAIIGAGPGGLTLARILQRNNVPVTIFELDSDAKKRDQGGSLDLHPKAGQAALQAAGLLSEFHKFARPEGDADKILAPDGSVLYDENVELSVKPKDPSAVKKQSSGIIDGRPEIDRGALRTILLDSITPGTIKYGKKLVKVEPTPNQNSGKHDLHFANGVIETGFDLVVGADGAWSKVRPLLTDVQPFYAGVTGVELWSLNVDSTNPWLSNYVGAGTLFLFDSERALISQRNGSFGVTDSIRVFAIVKQPEDWAEKSGIEWDNSKEMRSRIANEYFGGCGDDVKRAIEEAGDGMWVRKLYMLPVGLEWEGKKGLTLLGDAAHLMTPFAGVGVNVAMADAKDLAEKISAWAKTTTGNEDSEGLKTAVEEYEKEMFVRAKENALKTKKGLDGHFSATGGQHFANRLRGHAEERKKQKQNA